MVNTVMVMIICGGAMGLLMCCVVEQHEGGANPTESMTRALISDDSIARQSTLGPVQLGYVSPPHNTNHSIRRQHFILNTNNSRFLTFHKQVAPIIRYKVSRLDTLSTKKFYQTYPHWPCLLFIFINDWFLALPLIWQVFINSKKVFK
jgi:hypothetical protein